MKNSVNVAITVCLTALVSAGFGFAWQEPEKKVDGTPEKALESDKPVDGQFGAIDDMHHFMEYISQPSYLALKEILANEPADRRV